MIARASSSTMDFSRLGGDAFRLDCNATARDRDERTAPSEALYSERKLLQVTCT